MQADWLIQACANELTEIAVGADEFLFRLGDTPRDLYLVAVGEARARRYGTDGAEIVMQRSRAGELFAEAGLVAPRYSCEGHCPVASRVLRIPLATIKERIVADGEFALRFSQFLALAMRRQCARYERLRLKRAGERVLHYLNCELTGPAGADLELDIPLAETTSAWNRRPSIASWPIWRRRASSSANRAAARSASSAPRRRARPDFAARADPSLNQCM